MRAVVLSPPTDEAPGEGAGLRISLRAIQAEARAVRVRREGGLLERMRPGAAVGAAANSLSVVGVGGRAAEFAFASAGVRPIKHRPRHPTGFANREPRPLESESIRRAPSGSSDNNRSPKDQFRKGRPKRWAHVNLGQAERLVIRRTTQLRPTAPSGPARVPLKETRHLVVRITGLVSPVPSSA